jgi:hypothetical protein
MSTKNIRNLIKQLNDEILDNYEELKGKGLNDQTTTLYSSLIDFFKALPQEEPEEPEPERETETEKQVAISSPEEPKTKGLGERLAEQVKENDKVISQQSEYFGK